MYQRVRPAPPVPHLIDELLISFNFISLNVNSTY
jgi:hypothetical protein